MLVFFSHVFSNINIIINLRPCDEQEVETQINQKFLLCQSSCYEQKEDARVPSVLSTVIKTMKKFFCVKNQVGAKKLIQPPDCITNLDVTYLKYISMANFQLPESEKVAFVLERQNGHVTVQVRSSQYQGRLEATEMLRS